MIFYKQKHNITIWISKLCLDTKAIKTSVSWWNGLDQFCSTATPFGERKIWRLCQVSVVRCWRMSLNLISKYLFLEQKAQSLEEILTFLTQAGRSIHIFSESTHIEALIKPCKMMKIKTKSYLYNTTTQGAGWPRCWCWLGWYEHQYHGLLGPRQHGQQQPPRPQLGHAQCRGPRVYHGILPRHQENSSQEH